MKPLYFYSETPVSWCRRWIVRERLAVYPTGHTVCRFTLDGLLAN